MTFKAFAVVVVPFPFTDSSRSKKRPALVLSQERFQRKNGHVTLAMITSAKHSEWHGDVEIKDLASAGLPVESLVRQRLFTIDARLIEKQIGVLAVADIKSVQKAFSDHFSF